MVGINLGDSLLDRGHSFMMAQSGFVNGGGLDWLAYFPFIMVNLGSGNQNLEDLCSSEPVDGQHQGADQRASIIGWTFALAHICLALLEAASDPSLQSLGSPACYHDWYGSCGFHTFGLQPVL